MDIHGSLNRMRPLEAPGSPAGPIAAPHPVSTLWEWTITNPIARRPPVLCPRGARFLWGIGSRVTACGLSAWGPATLAWMVTDYYLLKPISADPILRFKVIRTVKSFIWSAAEPPWQSGREPALNLNGLPASGVLKAAVAELLSLSQLLHLHRCSGVTIKSNATTFIR